MKKDVYISGPILSMPMHVGALQYLAEEGVEIENIFASDGGIFLALLVASGYNLNLELLKAIKKLSSTRIVSRNPWTLWLTFRNDPLKKIQTRFNQYFAKSFGDLKHKIFCYYYDVKTHDTYLLRDIDSPVKLAASYTLLNKPYKVAGHNLINAEINPRHFHNIELPDNIIHLRGQMEIDITAADVFSKNTVKTFESLSSFAHIPKDLANKTIFLRSPKMHLLQSFWGLPSTALEELVREGYRLARDQYKKEGVKND